MRRDHRFMGARGVNTRRKRSRLTFKTRERIGVEHCRQLAGQRAIQRTRKAIEARDGARFDIKSFHDHAIGHGQIPLPVFEAEMPNWVKPKA